MEKIGIIVEAKKQLQALLAGAKDLDVLDDAARAVIQDFANLSAGSKAVDDLQKQYADLARSVNQARKASVDQGSAQIKDLENQRKELKRVVAAAKELERAQVAGAKPEQLKTLGKLRKEGVEVEGVEAGAEAVKKYGDKLAEAEKQIESLRTSGSKLTKEQVEGFEKQEIAIAATQKALRNLLKGGVDPWSRSLGAALKSSTELIKREQAAIETLRERTKDASTEEKRGLDEKIKSSETYIAVLQDAQRELSNLSQIEMARLGAVGVAGRGAVRTEIAGAAGEVGDIEKVREQGSAAMDRLKGLGKMALGGGIVAFLLSSVRTWAQIDTELLKVQRRFGDIEGSVWSLSNRLGFTKREMMELSREYGKISNVFEREGMGATIGYARTMGVPAAAAIRLREVGRWAEKPVDMKRYLSALERQGKELGLDRGRQEEMFNVLITQQQRMAQQVFGGYGSEGVPMGVMQGMDYLWGGTERGRGIRGLDYTTRLDEAMKDVSTDAVRFFKMRAYGFGQKRVDPVTGKEETIGLAEVQKRIEAGIYGFGPGGKSNLQDLLEHMERTYGAGQIGGEAQIQIMKAAFPGMKTFEVEPLLDLKERGMFSSKARETLMRYGKAQGITGQEKLDAWMTGIQKDLMGKTETEQAKILEGYLRPGTKGVLLEATKLDRANQERLSKIEQLEKGGIAKPGEIKTLKEEYQAALRARANIDTNVPELAKELAGPGFVQWDEFWERFGKAPEVTLKAFEEMGGKYVSVGEEFKVGLELTQRQIADAGMHLAKAFIALAGEEGLEGFKAELKLTGDSLGALAAFLEEKFPSITRLSSKGTTEALIGLAEASGGLSPEEAKSLVKTLKEDKFTSRAKSTIDYYWYKGVEKPWESLRGLSANTAKGVADYYKRNTVGAAEDVLDYYKGSVTEGIKTLQGGAGQKDQKITISFDQAHPLPIKIQQSGSDREIDEAIVEQIAKPLAQEVGRQVADTIKQEIGTDGLRVLNEPHQ